MAKERICTFGGSVISDSERIVFNKKLRQFLDENFEWFRDRAEDFELRARGDVIPNVVIRYFGDDNLYYDICAMIGDYIRFDIMDEHDRGYLTFWVNRVSGRLVRIFVRNKNTLAIQKALDFLIKPSWVD